jgi:hypothetical protein
MLVGDPPPTVKHCLSLLTSALLGHAAILHAESWILTDGSSFEGKVKVVTPSLVIFAPSEGQERAVETSKLSEASRQLLAEWLGLIAKAAPTLPAPEETVSRTVALSHPGRDPKAMDATQMDLIDSQYGLTGKVVGVVKEVQTLGKTGHKKLTFEGTDFNIFISKCFLEKSSEWKLDGLEGKTIQITGEIARYQEVVQIAAKEPTQIEVLP